MRIAMIGHKRYGSREGGVEVVVTELARRMAALGGSLGEWLGMVSLHHKTKHKKFLILVPAFLFIHIALGAWLLFFRG